MKNVVGKEDHVIVVKCGGTGAVDAEAVCRDVAELARSGQQVVLVHGGSHQIERLAGLLGVPLQTQVAPDGVPSRHTDDATMEVVTLALAGQVKPQLVAALQRLGVNAVGLTGLDGALLRAKRKPPQRSIVDGRKVLVRNNRAGTVHQVNVDLLRLLLAHGVVPVISPPALADDGEPVNVNADRVAAAVAGALGAHSLVLLTGAPGVLSDPADEHSLLRACVIAESGPPASIAMGGMALKLVAAREALLAGVANVRIADGRTAAPLSSEGTEITIGVAA